MFSLFDLEQNDFFPPQPKPTDWFTNEAHCLHWEKDKAEEEKSQWLLQQIPEEIYSFWLQSLTLA